MTTAPRLAFVGLAGISQAGKEFSADAPLYAEGESPARSFFGHYENATPPGLNSGPAKIQFSDGAEADAVLVAVDPARGGFRISGYLESTEQLMRFARHFANPS